MSELIAIVCLVAMTAAHLSIHQLPRTFWAFMMSLFYRRIHISDDIPNDNIATIVIANHGNGFVDPFLLQIALKRPLCKTVRADWLNHWLVKWFVKSLKAVPLAQQSQGLGETNKASFRKLCHTLDQGEWVVMFPEGLSHSRTKLYPFQKGTAHLAEQYMETTGKPIRILQLAMFYGDKSRLNSDVWVSLAGESIYYPHEGLPDKTKATMQWQQAIQTALPGDLRRPKKKQISWLIHTMPNYSDCNVSVNIAESILMHNSQLIALHSWLTQAKIELPILKQHQRYSDLVWRLFRELLILLTGTPIAIAGLVLNAPTIFIHYFLTRRNSQAEDKWASNAYVIGVPLYLTWFVAISSAFTPWSGPIFLVAGLYSLFFCKCLAERLRVIKTAYQAITEPVVGRQILAVADSVLKSQFFHRQHNA